MSSIPSFPRAKKPIDEIAPGQAAARGLRRAIGNAQGSVEGVLNVGVDVANKITAPARRFAGNATDFTRELTGNVARPDAGQPAQGMSPFALPRLSPTATAPVTTQPNPAPMPNPGPATPGVGALPAYLTPTTTKAAAPASVTPARNPASQATSAGATALTGGVSAPLPAPSLKSIDGRPGGLASSVNAQGNNVYDNASIGRLTERNASQGTGGAQSFGGTPAPAAGMSAPVTPMIQRPNTGGASVATIGIPGEAERRLQIAVDSATFSPARSRRARALQAGLVDNIYGRANAMQEQAAQGVRDQHAASTSTNIPGMEQDGQNARAQLGDQGESNRAALQEQGDSRRAALQEDGANFRLANRPEYQTDVDGVMNRVANGIALPVSDEKGNPLRTVTVQQQKANERRHDVLDSISARAVDSLPVGRNATYKEIQAARAQAAMTNGFEVIVNGAGERMVRIDGQWVHL